MGEPNSQPGLARPSRRRGSAVAITANLSVTVIALACIAACTIVLYVFLQNPPWP
jgi:hypothetical protein